jgi:hypothetical protein
MIKTLALIILLTFNNFTGLIAQPKANKTIVLIARSDVKKRFKLTKAEFQQFRKDKRNTTSDLFKPKTHTVSDTTLLADSVYVEAYRNFAYRQARTTLDSRLVMWIGGSIIAAGVTYIALVLHSIANMDFKFPD